MVGKQTSYDSLARGGPASSLRTGLLFLILCIGIALRILHVFDMTASPLFDHPVMDPGYHDTWARSIAAGEPITDGAPYFRAPLYPYFLATVYKIGGGNPLHPRLAQAALGIASLLLLWRIGRRLFGDRTALLALFLALLYPLFPYFEGELLITPLAVFLDLLLLHLLLRAGEGGGTGRWIAAGALLGLSALARPNILLFAPALPLWLLLRRRPFVRGVLLPSGAAALAAAAVIAPVTVRNAREGGDLVWIASQGGINFYLGNHPGVDGWSATAPGIRKDWEGGIEDSRRIAARDLGREPSASEVSAYWYRRGLDFLARNPGEGARNFARKAYLLLYGAELSNNQIIPFAARYSRIFSLLPLRYGVIVPLAFLGIAGRLRERRRWLLLFFLLFYGASIVLFFVCSRYRMPLVPVLLLFAADGLLRLGASFRRRRFASLAGRLALLALLLFFCNHGFGVVGPINYALGWEGEGRALLEQGDLAGAENRFREAIRVDPASRNAHHDLGVLLRERGDPAGAIAHFRASLAADPTNAEAHNNLGLTLAAMGRNDEAIEAYRRGIEEDPRHAGLRVNLAVLLQRLGRYGEAIVEYEAFLRSGARDGRVDANLGICRIRTGDAARGEEDLRRGVALAPNVPGPALLLAGYLEESGRVEEAEDLLAEAARRMPGEEAIREERAALERRAGM